MPIYNSLAKGGDLFATILDSLGYSPDLKQKQKGGSMKFELNLRIETLKAKFELILKLKIKKIVIHLFGE